MVGLAVSSIYHRHHDRIAAGGRNAVDRSSCHIGWRKQNTALLAPYTATSGSDVAQHLEITAIRIDTLQTAGGEEANGLSIR